MDHTRRVIFAFLSNLNISITFLLFLSIPFRQKLKEQKDQDSRKKKEEEERKRGEENKRKAHSNLLEIFNTIPKEKVQELLDENEGDIEETTNQLLTLVAKQENEKEYANKNNNGNNNKSNSNNKNNSNNNSKGEDLIRQRREEEERLQKEQEKRLRELKIQALTEKFEDLTEVQVIKALDATSWDIKKALQELFTISGVKKKDHLLILFPVSTYSSNI